jgi:hypothetical protein
MNKFKEPTKADIDFAKEFLAYYIAKKPSRLDYIDFFGKEMGKDISGKEEYSIVRKHKIQSGSIDTSWVMNNGYITSHKRDITSKAAISRLEKAEAGEIADAGNRSLYAKVDKRHAGKKVFEITISKKERGAPYGVDTVIIATLKGKVLKTKYAALFCPNWDENSPESLRLVRENIRANSRNSGALDRLTPIEY